MGNIKQSTNLYIDVCHKFILNKDGFLSAGVSKRETCFNKTALEGSSDWLRGLKRMCVW
jgi:hypothetical protein